MTWLTRQSGFTLIELLIVVAIIAILAAIAIANFLEAQVRSKVSRVKADMRSVGIALEMFAVDHNVYPEAEAGTPITELNDLTTPIAYITSVPYDIFRLGGKRPFDYVLFRFITGSPLQDDSSADPGRGGNPPMMCHMMEAPLDIASAAYNWLLFSWGPDHDEEYNYAGNHPRCLIDKRYDHTNGTVSSGDIYKVQGNAKLY